VEGVDDVVCTVDDMETMNRSRFLLQRVWSEEGGGTRVQGTEMILHRRKGVETPTSPVTSKGENITAFLEPLQWLL